MSLSDLASLGSFVSGIAVVFSFVFLGLQIRQSDRNQRAVLNAQSSSMFSEHMLRLTEPHFADLYGRAMEGEATFTTTETVQLMGFVAAILNDLEDVDTRRRLSLADADSIETAKYSTANLMSIPFVRAFWDLAATTYTPSFRSQVDAIIREASVQPPVDFLSMLRAHLAQAHNARPAGAP